MRVRPAAMAAIAVVVLLGGCTSDPSEKSAERSSQKPGKGPTASNAAAVVAFGEAPVPSDDVTYQPDVIVVGGGADSVRSVSGDALTWMIDGNAPNAKQLVPGKVMFLTSRAVGRVLAVAPRGPDLAVTVGPVDLADIVKDGHISINQAIDVSKMTFQAYPDVGGTSDYKESATPNSSRATPLVARFGSVRSAPLPPPTADGSGKVTVGDFSVELGRKVGGASAETSVKLSYKQRGVSLGLNLVAKYTDPKLQSDLTFANGKSTASHVRVSGLKEIDMSLLSGSTAGLSGNFRTRLEVPATLDVPFAAGPVPMNLSFKFKFIVETAFSAKNGNVAATGKIGVSGPIGYDRTSTGAVTVVTPDVSLLENPIDNLSGVSVGVNGVVIAAQLKVLLGIGMAAMQVGPFASVTGSFGLTDGSSIGIIHCKQTSADVVLGGGMGFSFAPKEISWLKDVLGKLGSFVPKLESEFANGSKTVLHEVYVKPKTSVCGG